MPLGAVTPCRVSPHLQYPALRMQPVRNLMFNFILYLFIKV